MATLEDWTDVMYINMWGCTKYGYDFNATAVANGIPNAMGCDPHESQEQPVISAVFFSFFIVVGALVLLTLFIGVVTTAMEEAQNEQKEDDRQSEKLDKLKVGLDISDDVVEMYSTVFNMLDDDKSGCVEEVELKLGLEMVDIDKSDDEIKAMLKEVDDDGSGEVDFAEFVQFMHTHGRASGNRQEKGEGGKEVDAPTDPSGAGNAAGSRRVVPE